MAAIQLQGKLLLTGEILVVTGLRIGGAGTGLEIGGVENIVVRNPLSNEPYIPGSSIKGKLRSLLDREIGTELNRFVRRGHSPVRIHECEKGDEYSQCIVCRLFGVAGEREFAMPSRIYVRDVALTQESRERLERTRTDLPFTEVKLEAAIDRITSAAVPRQMERVPAGAVFGPFEFVFNVYEERDISELFPRFLRALVLLEDDYLGGQGTRGSGKIAFQNMSVVLKSRRYYAGEEEPLLLKRDIKKLPDLLQESEQLQRQLQAHLFPKA
jgi:CRISPR-associated protein Csm3